MDDMEYLEMFAYGEYNTGKPNSEILGAALGKIVAKLIGEAK